LLTTLTEGDTVKRTLIALSITAALPLLALAHESARGPKGGPLADAAGHHVEMVAKGTDLVLYLRGESDEPHASAGARIARAIVQDGGKTATVPLEPADANKLVGRLPQPLGKGDRVVVSTTLADGHAGRSRTALLGEALRGRDRVGMARRGGRGALGLLGQGRLH